MKKLLLSLLTITTLGSHVLAQRSVLPLVEEGRVWHVVSLHPTDVPEPGTEKDYYKDLKGRWCVGFPYEYVLKGDTAMNGQTYKKLIRTDISLFCCGLRQDGNRVYRCDEKGSSEYVVFDFDIKSGDIFTNYNNSSDKMRVEQVDVITVDGVERRVLKMWACDDELGINDGLVDIWIEGIGCMNGPNYPFWWTATNSQSLLMDCFQNGQQLINIGNFIDIINSGISPIIQSDVKISSSTNYDLQGRRLMQQPRKGVYIRGGRKIVAR